MMTQSDVEKVFEELFERCRNTLLKKGMEYAPNIDRLQNFRCAAQMQRSSLAEVCGGFMAKHTISVYDMINDTNRSYSLDEWDEKIVDHMNYLILLRAILTEEYIYPEPATLENPHHHDITAKAQWRP